MARYLLAAFSVLCVVRGYSYLPAAGPSTLPPGLDLIVAVFPIWAWGTLWCISGVLGLWAAIENRPRVFYLAMPLLLSIHLIWTLSYLGGWIDEGGRTYLNTATYGALTLGAYSLLRAVRERRG